MNGYDFRMFYEKYAIYVVSAYLKTDPNTANHYSLIQSNSDADFELLGVRYDVKISSPVITSKSKKQSVWDFSLRKVFNGKRGGPNHKHCEFYVCVGMLKGIPSKVFLIPFEECPTNHLRVSIQGNSKYHKYEI